ncbi:hypothetical protein CIB84_007848 [Bambusicola thoracicus]|uniref:Radial spoke head protein 9 homolog n=1 Tax=Bambusicola thoracicus TaxID=9083 RepID=A0A2P4SWA4_BAMTH|nr:hypothetical protein CIB84_007848 [Bambusicola thoracicus]
MVEQAALLKGLFQGDPSFEYEYAEVNAEDDERFLEDGLSLTEAKKLSSYFHFTEPVNLKNKTLLEKADLDPSTDFLDSLEHDVPQGFVIGVLFSFVSRRNAVAAVDDSVVLSMFPLENGHQGLKLGIDGMSLSD